MAVPQLCHVSHRASRRKKERCWPRGTFSKRPAASWGRAIAPCLQEASRRRAREAAVGLPSVSGTSSSRHRWLACSRARFALLPARSRSSASLSPVPAIFDVKVLRRHDSPKGWLARAWYILGRTSTCTSRCIGAPPSKTLSRRRQAYAIEGGRPPGRDLGGGSRIGGPAATSTVQDQTPSRPGPFCAAAADSAPGVAGPWASTDATPKLAGARAETNCRHGDRRYMCVYCLW